MPDARAHLVMGPMCSGKSSELISTALRYRAVDFSVLVVKPTVDVRSIDVRTHVLGGARLDCVSVDPQHWEKLWDVESYIYASVICVDEVQFFGRSIVDALHKMLGDKKTVFMYGLDGSAEQKPMWPMHEVIPLCDTVKKLNAMCTCGKQAPFTVCDKPLPQDGILIEAADIHYMPMCRECMLAWQSS